MHYTIGSGAWYTEDGKMENVPGGDIGGMEKYGTDPATHRPKFFKLWMKAIEKFTFPEEIFVEDAHSEVIPDLAIENRVPLYWRRREENLGHNKGWTAGVINGLYFAHINERSHFVYIEQDVLVWGRGIIEHCIDQMTKPMMVGCACKCPWNIQQSFVIIKADFYDKFVNTVLPFSLYIDKGIMPEKWWFEQFKDDMEILPFCGGRERPLDWDAKFGYAQQIKKDELKIFKEILK